MSADTELREVRVPHKPRVELMRDAVQAGREGELALIGDLSQSGDLAKRLGSALDLITEACKTVDPTFHANLEIDQGAAQGLVVANERGSLFAAFTYTISAMIIRSEAQPTVVVPLAAEDGGERLGAAIEKIVTAFFDRNAPR